MTIGIFDSGIGGLTVLAEILNQHVVAREGSGANFIYLTDSKNLPYGEKSDDEIYGLTRACVQKLIDFGSQIIVIACNTATAICIDRLRIEFNVPFIGTEPAIKLAKGKTVLLATPASNRADRIKRLHKNFCGELAVPDCAGLATAIENGQGKEMVGDILAPYQNWAETVVLGCTHYGFLKNYIKKLCPNVTVLDGGTGIANQLGRIVEKTILLF